MKKIILFFFLFVTSIIHSQTILGTVVDSNEEPIFGAFIYFDGTSYGTTTDIDGKFSFEIKSSINTPLVISYVGYEKIYLKEIDFNKRYKFIMQESIENLNEVVVSNNKFSRKQMLTIFKNQFLGVTKAGKRCTIENEDELYFTYDNDNFLLKAFADKPLIINNPFLGYKIYFDINSFEAKFYKYSIKNSDIYSSIYIGTSRFEETSNSIKIVKNREKAFNGSLLQFFRNFAKMSWGKDKFVLFYKSFQDNPKNHFTINSPFDKSTKVIIFPQESNLKSKGFIAEFGLLYNNKEQSKIIFHTDNFEIDEFGLFTNYDKIYFSGALSEKKVGLMLPSNYGIE